MTAKLQKICEQFRAVTRRMLLSLGVSRLLVFALATMALLILCDFIFHFGIGGRLLALLALLAVAGAVFYFDLYRPLGLRWTDKQVLNYLDRTIPDSQDRLINIDELADLDHISESQTPEGRAVIEQAVAGLTPAVEQVRVGGVVRNASVRSWRTWALGAAAAALVFGLLFQLAFESGYTGIGLRRLFLFWDSAARWPSSTWFVMVNPKPGEEGAGVPEGEDLIIQAEVHGRGPDQITLTYYGVDENGEEKGRAIERTMNFDRDEDVASLAFAKIGDSIKFRIEGGDGETGWITVKVIKRPAIVDVTAYYVFPPYSQVPPKAEKSATLTGLEGTQVRLVFTASTPLKEAWIQMADQPARIKPKMLEGNRQFEWTCQLARTTSYTIGLLDDYGNREKRSETYRIKVLEDRPPVARLLEPAGDLEVTRNAVFPIEYRAEDDFGLKAVQLLVSLNGAAPAVLSDKITGPIVQIGRVSGNRFEWDLAKMDPPLKDVNKVEYWLKVQDVNPTGRGKSESAHLLLTIRSETDVQDSVLLVAKMLITEALNGANNQKWAYFDSIYWRKGDPRRPQMTAQDRKDLLRQMEGEQEAAARAATALEGRFKALSVEMRRNRMGDAFFEKRLDQLGNLIGAMASDIQPKLMVALAEARPTSAAEDTEAGREAKMRKVLDGMERPQKLAALQWRQILYLLMDWNDLQNVLVKTKRLKEKQQKVYDDSFAAAPRWIGLEIEDLSEEDARLLEVLGQQEDAIFEAQGALEEEFMTLAAQAQVLKRLAVFEPLWKNVQLLKKEAIRDKINQTARGIKMNTVDATLKDQLFVVQVYTIVVTKLEEAGREPPKLVAVNPDASNAQLAFLDTREVEGPVRSPDESVIDPEKQRAIDELIRDMGQSVRIAQAPPPNSPEQWMVVLQGILDEQVILYTGYTDNKFKGAPRSPRYRTLRLGMLGIRVDRASEAAGKAVELLKTHECAEALPYVQSLAADIANVRKLIASGQVGTGVQAYEKEVSAAVQASRDALLFRAKAIADIQSRKDSGGTDEFKRPFIVLDDNMPAVSQMRKDLEWAVVLQGDVNGKTKRLADYRAGKTESSPLLEQVNATALAQAIQRQARAEALAKGVLAAKIVGDKLAGRVADEMLADLTQKAPDFAKSMEALKAGKFDDESLTLQGGLMVALRGALDNLNSLADEREQPIYEKPKSEEDILAAGSEVTAKMGTMTQAELKAEIERVRNLALHNFQFQVIAENVKKSSLRPEVQRFLLDSLAKEPNPRYQMLMGAYFNGVIQNALPSEIRMKFEGGEGEKKTGPESGAAPAAGGDEGGSADASAKGSPDA